MKAFGKNRQKITLYLDFTCLWSYIGWRNLIKAIAVRPVKCPYPELCYRSHELNNSIASDDVILFQEYMLHRFGDRAGIRDWQDIIFQAGIDAGIMIDFSRIEYIFNTRLLHRMMKALQEKAHAHRDSYHDLHKFIETVFHQIIIQGRVLNNTDKIAKYTGYDYYEILGAGSEEEWNQQVENDILHSRSAGITGIPCYGFGADYSLFGAQGVRGYIAMLDLLFETSQAPEQDERLASLVQIV